VFHLKLLRRILADWAWIDVILFDSMSAPWLLPLRVVRKLTGRRRPLLVMDTRTLHMIPKTKENWRSRLLKVFHRLMTRAGNRWADGRLTITHRLAQALRVPPERLWGVWPSGVDLDRFVLAQKARHWPSPEEPIHLIYIGVLHYERNLMALSRAVEEANTKGLAFVLLLVGDGTERADLEKFAGQTGGRIRVIRPFPHDQVWTVLAQAHVGCLPFPDEERFQVSSPIKLFEYMASGLPILATRIACHTDVMGSSNYAFWAEKADVPGLGAALSVVWERRNSLAAMGRDAAAAAQAWTWKNSAEKLRRALEKGVASQDLEAIPRSECCQKD